jgi:hypothetical protein
LQQQQLSGIQHSLVGEPGLLPTADQLYQFPKGLNDEHPHRFRKYGSADDDTLLQFIQMHLNPVNARR